MRASSLALLLLTVPAFARAASDADPTARQGSAASPRWSSSPGAEQPAAKPPASAKAPSSEARALSRALVPEQTWDRLLDRSADGLSEAVSRSLRAKGEKVPDGLRSTLRRELAKDLAYAQAIDAQALALEKRFSGDEMQKAAAFYSSPLGKKMLDRLPEAQSEVGDQLQERLATVVPGILRRVAPSAVAPEPDGAPKGTGAGEADEAEPAPTAPKSRGL